MLMRSVYSQLAPAGRRGRLTVLIFHRVLDRPDPLLPDEPDAVEFERRMRWVADWFNVIPLAEAIDRLAAGTLPPRAAAITFDDGYADNHRVAAPILRRLGLHATFFVATGFLDGGRMWNDTVIEVLRRCGGPRLALDDFGLGTHDVSAVPARRAAIPALLGQLKYLPPEQRLERVAQLAARAGALLPDDLMMTREQVRDLHRQGLAIGAHTVSHPILQRVPLAAARDEIDRGRRELESIIGAPVRLFAYPNGKPDGDYGRPHVDLVRDLGFDGAVSTAWGAARGESDPYQLPRFTPWDRSRLRFGLRLARNFLEPVRCATA